MGFGDDEDILQDFLVEAGEILEQLSEQLVQLEQTPDDTNLLNAIFRGFHTVKGGAGFLQLEAMVDCCHVTENLFDILRNGKRSVTPELMDVVLQALDTVNGQFEQVSQRTEMSPAPPELIAQLERLVSCEDLAEVPATMEEQPPAADEATPTPSQLEAGHSEATADSPPPVGQGDITDEEFEQLLDAISTEDKPSTKPAEATALERENLGQENLGQEKEPLEIQGAGQHGSGSDDITEDEFENLLDELHGQGKGPGTTDKASSPAGNPASGDDITEQEFDALLDQLHGKGKGPGKDSTGASTQGSASGQSSVSGQSSGSELISDDEFEDLLDQLHGKGKGPAANNSATSNEATQAKASAGGGASPSSGKASPAQRASTSPQSKSPQSNSQSAAATKPPPSPPAKSPTPEPAGGSAVPAGETTVRVDTQRLDDIMNMVGELVLVRNRLVRLGDTVSDEALTKAVSNLDVVTADLQTSVMKTRMQPIKKVFGRFPRVVRDLARNLKKEINLELVGEDTDLDKNLVEALADPLVHLVRNAVDHGIELPDAREAKGKTRVGKIVLSAEQEGDHILLSITDDGGGMDPDVLRGKAVEKGLMDEDASQRLSDAEAFNLIFAPGFSTKSEISDVSGRGVGMDVVKTKINQLNGAINIHSSPGEGSRIVIKVPLTLAIMPTLMILLGKQTFALPLVSVNEIFYMDLTKINIVDGQECVTIREKAIPIFHLKRWLVKDGYAAESPKEAHIVMVSVGTQKVGFVVDQLIGQEEVVIKPLGKMLHGTPGMAGATITGDGTIALILDVPSMLKRYAGH